MKNTRQLAVIAATGMLAFATSNVQAIELVLTIKGKATSQSEPTTKNGVTTYSTVTTSVGTKDVLTRLGIIYGTPIPDGAVLVYDSDADVVSAGTVSIAGGSSPSIFTIQNRDGGIVLDVSTNFSFFGGEVDVLTGKVTEATGAEKTTQEVIGTFIFEPGNGNDFSIIGLASSQFSQSAAKNNEAKVSESIKLSGSGPGQVGGENALVEGSVSAKGKDVVETTPPPPVSE